MKHKIALMNSNLCEAGGTGRVTAILSAELAKTYDCHIITQWHAGEYVFPIAKGVKVFSLYPQRRRLRHMLFDAVRRIKQYVREQGIELIIVVGRNNGLVPLLVKLALGKSVKLIWSEHNAVSSYQFYNESWKQKIYRHILQQLILHVPDKVTVLTEREKGYYQQTYHIAPQGFVVIPNFMEERLLKEARPYGGTSKRLLTVANFDYQKGYEYLLEVAKGVLRSHPEWLWDIYGGGDLAYRDVIAEKIQAEGLADRLVLKGTDSQLYKRYGDYALQVMTSRHEGLPMTLMEGKVNHLPEVAFDIYSGPSDIILNGVNGYLVKPFDVEPMADRISFLMDHPEVRQDFSEHAYDNIDNFRKEAVMAKWMGLIDEVLKR